MRDAALQDLSLAQSPLPMPLLNAIGLNGGEVQMKNPSSDESGTNNSPPSSSRSDSNDSNKAGQDAFLQLLKIDAQKVDASTSRPSQVNLEDGEIPDPSSGKHQNKVKVDTSNANPGPSTPPPDKQPVKSDERAETKDVKMEDLTTMSLD